MEKGRQMEKGKEGGREKVEGKMGRGREKRK